MTKTIDLRVISTCTAVLLASPAFAQNAFRPLPEMPELRGLVGGAGAASLSAAARTRALFDEIDAAAEGARERTFVEVRATAGATAGVDLQGGGELAMQSGGWHATIGTALAEDRIAALSLDTEAFFYELGGANGLVPGVSQPFNDLYQARIAGIVRTQSGATPGFFAGFQLALCGEDNADAKDSLVVGGMGGLRYDPSPELGLELGVAALSRLEDDPWLWPFIGFDWQANERVSFQAKGTSLEGRVALDEHWSVFGRAEYVLRQFRLNSDNPLPSGVFRDEEIRAGLGVTRTSDDGFQFELLGGLDLWRELSTLDSNGTKITEVEADPAPFVALSLTLAL